MTEYEASHMLDGSYYAERVVKADKKRLLKAIASIPGLGTGFAVGAFVYGKLAGAAWAGVKGSAGLASSLKGFGLSAGLAVGPSGVGTANAAAAGTVVGLGAAVTVVPLGLLAVALANPLRRRFMQGYRERDFTWKWGSWPGNY